ncbi:N-acetylmuramoyl-L-alanine amidase [Salibacterium aidingense]|uniref:N-acetylmuramoyl-L-alanine amidase n=1 Tax=Salibacterium aidingense TaxID=384933 RepID=UPI0003FA3779|nr:N-acetylmuramoyl-L-alanine amidase [Salibacterium aidingense]
MPYISRKIIREEDFVIFYKKISYSMMAAALTISVLPALSQNQAEASDRYSDVSSSYWAAEEIAYLTEQGVASGDESGEFRPEEPLTRAQASVMMTSALGEEGLYSSSAAFTDVDTEFWAYASIERAAELDIFQGSNGEFDPNGEIEKAQVAAVVSRALFEQADPDASLQFDDIENGFWAEEYITTLVDQGIIENEGEFDPNSPATRAEFSAYLARALEENIESSEDSPSEEDLADDNVMYKGEVDADTPLNVRSGPDVSYESLDKLEDGTTIDIYDRNGDWLKVEHEGTWAYVHGNYINNADNIDSDEKESEEIPDETEGENPEEGTADVPDDVDKENIISVAKVTVDDLNVRTDGSTDGDVISKLNSGDTVDVYEHTGEDWALVDYGDGEGYVHRYYLQEKEPGEDALTNQTIVVDAGHGDHDNGASGNGLIEKDINLDVALEVEERLEEADVDVVMTRSDDTFLGLNERVEVAESADADAFISIHSNAYKASAHGAETYYNNNYKGSESRALAESIQEELVNQTGMSDRRVSDAGFVVIKNTTMPSSLIELGFVTNPDDAQRMKQESYPDEAADAIFDGIDNYYNW